MMLLQEIHEFELRIETKFEGKLKKPAMIIHFQLRFNPHFEYINFMCQHHLTNRFHVAVRLFSNRSQSQMTSKCGKNKKRGTRGDSRLCD